MPSTSYVTAIFVLYLLTLVLGAIIYTHYTIYVAHRDHPAPVLEALWPVRDQGALRRARSRDPAGLLVLLAGAQCRGRDRARAMLTALLAVIVWWNFLVGHIINNLRGFA